MSDARTIHDSRGRQERSNALNMALERQAAALERHADAFERLAAAAERVVTAWEQRQAAIIARNQAAIEQELEKADEILRGGKGK